MADEVSAQLIADIPSAEGGSSIKPIQLLHKRGVIPTAEQTAHREKVLQKLNCTLLGESFAELKGTIPLASKNTISRVTYISVPIESFGIGVWTKDDPLVLCIAGTPTEQTFFLYARSCFRQNRDIVIQKSDKWGLNMSELHYEGVDIHIQYHQSSIVDCWTKLTDENESSDPTENMTRQSRKRYANFVKSKQLALVFRDPFARDCCYAAVAWATFRGLISRPFGLLDRNYIVVMAAIALDRMPEDHKDLTAFLTEFFSLPFRDRLQHSHQGSLALQPEDIAAQMQAVLSAEMQSSKVKISNIVGSELTILQPAFRNFGKAYTTYLRVGVSHWGQSSQACGKFFAWMNETIADLAVELSTSLWPRLTVRPWPYRLVEKSSVSKAQETYHEGTYFIGFTINSEGFNSGDVTRISTRTIKRVTEDERFDALSSHIYALLLDTIEGNKFWVPDRRNWGPIPEDAGSDDESDDNELQDPMPSQPSRIRRAGKASKPTHSGSPLPEQQQHPQSPRNSPLRPALDVLHRIQHDASMDSADYTVGYLDRFLGMKELALDKWDGGEASSESFIPQSRIWYFVRKSDGTRVWDRETKLDLVFGSGSGSGKGH